MLIAKSAYLILKSLPIFLLGLPYKNRYEIQYAQFSHFPVYANFICRWKIWAPWLGFASSNLGLLGFTCKADKTRKSVGTWSPKTFRCLRQVVGSKYCKAKTLVWSCSFSCMYIAVFLSFYLIFWWPSLRHPITVDSFLASGEYWGWVSSKRRGLHASCLE